MFGGIQHLLEVTNNLNGETEMFFFLQSIKEEANQNLKYSTSSFIMYVIHNKPL